LLLAHGADINQPGTSDETPLMDAARHGDADMVKFLLSHRADVNARASYATRPFIRQLSGIMWRQAGSCSSMVRIPPSKGTDGLSRKK